MFKTSSSGAYTEVLPGVHLKTTVYGEHSLLTEIRMEKGAVIPPHRHPHEQTGYMISGQMEFMVDGVATLAHPGDSWSLPGNSDHGATALETSLVVEVFSPVREEYLAYFTPTE